VRFTSSLVTVNRKPTERVATSHPSTQAAPSLQAWPSSSFIIHQGNFSLPRQSQSQTQNHKLTPIQQHCLSLTSRHTPHTMPGDLPVSLGRLEELAAKYGTPLQLYDEHAMRANAKYLFQVCTNVVP
jgi:hypothetical protein